MSKQKRKRIPRKKLEEDVSASWECLDMAKDALEGLGTDMSGTPPMFFPEAIVSTVFRYCGMVRDGQLIFGEDKNGRPSWRRADGKLLRGDLPSRREVGGPDGNGP